MVIDPADAIKEAHRLVCRGYTDVVDGDLSKYFDTIPHSDLLGSVASSPVADARLKRWRGQRS
jgi:retron-type reverse transcriptase